MPKRLKRFTCVCGDSHFYFRYDRTYTEKEINEAFKQRVSKWKPEVFPGLVLRDEQGQCYRPELTIALVPTEDTYV